MPQKISNNPVKGTSDWLPEEFAVRRYIFETWRKVNRQFGYDEYLTPFIESADIYRAKSGEDVGGKDLLVVTDRAGRELAFRPEMTPSVTRMVTKFYRQATKPLRLFSIANFWRNERPQRGRNREFWQLNSDIFGSEAVSADIEILQLALQIMLALKPPQGSFTLYLNHRNLIDVFLTDIANVPDHIRIQIVRILDKFDKLPLETFQGSLGDLNIEKQTVDILTRFMQSKNADQLLDNFPMLEKNPGYRQINHIANTLGELGYSEWIAVNPSIIRGFDYYDGMVFEIFDNHPENNRSMFGGGRYNGLADIFGKQNIPAVGFAPGDETTRLFLQNWNLVPDYLKEKQSIYLPLLDDNLSMHVGKLAHQLRSVAVAVEQGLETQTLKQALSYANRKKLRRVIILGTDEVGKNIVNLKDMQTGEQKAYTEASLIDELTSK
jgi:histidyl-tRNA synthetase